MSDTLVARVTIKEIGVRNINATEVVTLKTDQGSFQFWEFKKDGSNTKAYLQYKKFRFSSGDSVEVHYSERVSNDTNPNTGKPYVNRSVLFFGETNDVPNSGGNTPSSIPVQTHTVQAPQANPSMGQAALMGRLSDVESKVAVLWADRKAGGAMGGVTTPMTNSTIPMPTHPEIPTINLDDIDEAELQLTDVPF